MDEYEYRWTKLQMLKMLSEAISIIFPLVPYSQ